MKYILFLFALYGYSSLPTLESLFRNGNNKDILLSTVKVEMDIEEKNSNEKHRIWLIYKINKNESVDLYQTVFKLVNGKLRPIRVKAYRSFIYYILRNRGFKNSQEIFYSLMNSLALNDSRAMTNFLSKNVANFKSNKELINKEKLALLIKYKNFLKKNSNGSSPLEGKTEEETKQIKNILNNSFYFEDSNVSLVKENDEIYIKSSYNDFFTKFSNENHRLLEFSYSNINFKMTNYVLHNGQHELPTYIKIINDDKEYDVTIRSLRHYNASSNFLYNQTLKIEKNIHKNSQNSLSDLIL